MKIRFSFLIVVAFLSACGDNKGDSEVKDNVPTSNSNSSSASSFTLFSSLCGLVEDSCGMGMLVTHQKTTAIDGKTIHTFLDPNGGTLDLVESCGSFQSEADGLWEVSGCKLNEIVQGEAFVVYDRNFEPGSKHLVEVYRTDLANGAITDAFGNVTNFTDLADVQSKWALFNDSMGSNCSIPMGWCSVDFKVL